MINFIGQCGPILGTRLYPGHEAPRFIKGQSVCACFMFFSAGMALFLRYLLVRENHWLLQKHGDPDCRTDRKGVEGEETLGGKKVGVENYGPRFRYVL